MEEKKDYSLLRKMIIEAQMKKCRIILNLNYNYLTNNLVLDGDYVAFTDVTGKKIVACVPAISYIEIFENQ